MTAPTDRPLRIAHLLVGRPREDSANGVDQTVRQLSIALAQIGQAVTVLCISRKEPVAVPGVEVRCHSPHRWPFILPSTLRRDLDAFAPHVLHLHSVYVPANAAAARWARKRNIPYVVEPAGGLSEAAEHRRRWAKRWYARFVERPMLNRAAFVRSVGDTAAIDAFGVDAEVVVASKGVDLTVPTERDRRWIETRMPDLAGTPVVAFLGRLDPLHKGLDMLIDALGQVEANAVLLLAGPDHEGQEAQLRARTHRLGLDDRIRFLGPVAGVAKAGLLQGCDLFVHTSRWEGGVPFSVLEAAATAAPLMLTPGADRQGVFGEEACVRVEAEPHAIAAGLRRFLAASDVDRKELGGRARAIVERDFRWRDTARATVDAYRAVLAGRRP